MVAASPPDRYWSPPGLLRWAEDALGQDVALYFGGASADAQCERLKLRPDFGEIGQYCELADAVI